MKIVDECKNAGLPKPEIREEFGSIVVYLPQGGQVTNKVKVKAQETSETKPRF